MTQQSRLSQRASANSRSTANVPDPPTGHARQFALRVDQKKDVNRRPPAQLSHRNPGGIHPRVPTRQCQPVFLPWLQPGGLTEVACALALKAVRVFAVAIRFTALTLTFAPTLARPWAPMLRASALSTAARTSPAAGTITTSKFLPIWRLPSFPLKQTLFVPDL